MEEYKIGNILVKEIYRKPTPIPKEPNATKAWVRCVCYCGKEFTTTFGNIKNGHTRSCGCLLKKVTGDRARTHGLTRTKEYRIWADMNNRCYNPNNTRYLDYGGRGIVVCERWRVSFLNFLEDMKKRPGLGYSIDRIDVNGNYCPENCRWATQKEQCRNQRTSKYLTYKGETKTMAEWADITNIRSKTISKRLIRGWSIEKSLETPTLVMPSNIARTKYK